MAELALLLAAALVATLAWARLLWLLDERSAWMRRAVLAALAYTRASADEVRALLLSAFYYGFGLLVAALFALGWGLGGQLFGLSAALPLLVLLGVIAQISLADLLVTLYCALTRSGPERFAEVRDIPWMAGLRALPAGLAPWGAAVAAAIEELFFRGVLLLLLLRLGVAPPAAIALAAALFCLHQLLQVETVFQAAVIGAGSLAIGLVGGALVVASGSVVPAILCHGAFVLFFLRRGEARRGALGDAAHSAGSRA